MPRRKGNSAARVNARLHVMKNIPLPPRRGLRDERFPWEDMEPMNSFFVPTDFDGDKPTQAIMAKRMAARGHAASKRLTRELGQAVQFIARPWSEKGRGRQPAVEGVMVWRTK